MLTYIIVFIILILFLLVYFKVADKLNIVDKPNERSSHTTVTLRGGGVVIWFVALLYFALHVKSSYLFFTGITIVSLISFWDDITSLPNKIRLLAQLAAISLIFIDLGAFTSLHWWMIPIAYIFALGIINAYNFMDGINGITGLYTVVVLLSFYYVNDKYLVFEDNDFIIFPLLACIAFLFFNYRKKAICFAGDVGSIAIAFFVIYLLLKLSLATQSVVWILFLAIYGVDTVSTIVHRLFLKQNIFKAHRLHYYQILSNECKIDHRIVSLLYGIVQAMISFTVIELYFRLKINDLILMSIVFSIIMLIYTTKFYLTKRHKALLK